MANYLHIFRAGVNHTLQVSVLSEDLLVLITSYIIIAITINTSHLVWWKKSPNMHVVFLALAQLLTLFSGSAGLGLGGGEMIGPRQCAYNAGRGNF